MKDSKQRRKSKTTNKRKISHIKKIKRKTANLSKKDLTEVFELENYVISEKNLNIEISKKEESKNQQDELDKLLKNQADIYYYPSQKKKRGISHLSKSNEGQIKNETFKKFKRYQRGLVSPHLLNLKEKNNLISQGQKPQKTNIYQPSKGAILARPNLSFSTFKVNLLKKIVSKRKNRLSRLNIIYRLKIAINFSLICLLLLTPIYSTMFLTRLNFMKDKISIHGAKALTELQNAAQSTLSSNYSQAISNFKQAADNFSEAKDILDNYNNILWKIANYLPIIDKKINSTKNILNAGQKISLAASSLSDLLNNFTLNNNSWTLTENLYELKVNLAEVSKQLELVLISLNDLDINLLPTSYQDQYKSYKNQLPNLLASLQNIQKNLDAAYEILAPNEKKQYLIFFQNTSELRGSGGFMGSFALVKIKNGEIVDLEIPGGGPYDLKGSLTKRVISPEPMHLVGTRWQIWDANWWPDFSTTAQKIMWFYEASGGQTVDGVITINSNVLPQLLQLTGNIYLEDYKKLMTPDNIIPTLQYAVEYEYDKKENKPKQIIADLTPLLIDRLLNIDGEKMTELLNIIINALREKDIQMYFPNQSLETKILELDWGGSIKNTEGDYLMVVSQNIGGGKTDSVVSQTINHHSEILADGTIYNTVSITRKHNGDPNDIFERINNVSYIRVYVPRGSELIEINGYQPPPRSAYKNIEANYQEDEFLQAVSGPIYLDEKTGTRINNEFNKTVFGHWLQVKPNEEQTLTIKYKLPFKLKQSDQKSNFITNIIDFFQPQKRELENYSLLIQKQSGSHSQFISSLTLPSEKKIIWARTTANQTIDIDTNTLLFSTPLTTDQSYAVIIE